MTCKYCGDTMEFEDEERDGNKYYEYWKCSSCNGRLTKEGFITHMEDRWNLDDIIDELEVE